MPRNPIEVQIVSSQKTFVQRVSAYVPIFISILALATAIGGAYETRRHNRLGVKPSIHFVREGAKTHPPVGLLVHNTGLGPARISQFAIFLDKKKMENDAGPDWEGVSKRITNLFLGTTPEWYFLGNNSQIKAGESINLYVTTPANVKDFEAFRELLYKRLIIRIHVCSLYDECFDACSSDTGDCESIYLGN